MHKLFLMAVVAITFASCSKERLVGEGNVRTEDRNVSNFTRVITSGSTNVHITRGSNFKVEVRGYENLLPYMETNVVNNTLEIGYEDVKSVRNDNVEVYITMPALERVKVDGSADLDVKGLFNSTALEASIAGSGNIHIEQGTAANFKTSIDGSGNIRAFGLIAEKADVAITGSGTTELTAVQNLKVTISGSGTVYYKGSPIVESSVSGSGKVIHRP